jgi:catechol 2,3-dioxygenase-like lactoylglutathione lyase family enzyme
LAHEAPAAKGGFDMQQQISVISIGVSDVARARRFYAEGFGWKPVFENGDIIFFQMNGFVFGVWNRSSMEEDANRRGLLTPGAFSLAHNVLAKENVEPVMKKLEAAGGRVIRPADAPPHGGFRGYVADPDDHAWEIAWNPAWPINESGMVRFGA